MVTRHAYCLHEIRINLEIAPVAVRITIPNSIMKITKYYVYIHYIYTHIYIHAYTYRDTKGRERTLRTRKILISHCTYIHEHEIDIMTMIVYFDIQQIRKADAYCNILAINSRSKLHMYKLCQYYLSSIENINNLQAADAT